MSYLQKTKHITISAPIPSVLSPQSVKTAVQNHPFMLNLSPIVTSHTPIDPSNPSITSSKDSSSKTPQIPHEPDFASAQWYRVSETVPLIGNINFLAAFKNTPDGQESIVHAPGGLRMHVRYSIESGEKVDATLSQAIDASATAPTSRAQDHENANAELSAPEVSITPATPILQSDADTGADAVTSEQDRNDSANETSAPPRSSQQPGSEVAGAGASIADPQRSKDWAFLGDHGHGNVLREECTLQANVFMMPFITFNFESVHRKMQARLFEILAKGEGPGESS